jgi:homoserine acetyltransferase
MRRAKGSAARPLVAQLGIGHCGSMPSRARPASDRLKTYGQLNAARSNAVLICHALTRSARRERASRYQEGGLVETTVGLGRPIDTERYFVICPNVVGACRHDRPIVDRS